jgi:TP901 family phage tail tape measure protein
MAGLAAQAGQSGIAYKDLGSFMMLAAKASSGWDMAPKEAAQRLAEIKSLTQWTIPQLAEYADKFNALADSSSASEKDVVRMFQRASASAKAAGVSFDTSLAALTALKSTGMEESTSARFWNSFASKLATAGMGGRGAKQAAEGFKTLGLSIKQVEKGMKSDATKTILDVLDRLDKSPNKATAAVEIFGREWWDEAARAGQALPEIRKNLETLSSGKWRHSLDKNLENDLSTTDNHLKRFKAMVSEIGDGMMRWALPPINEQLEKTLKSFEALKKTGFLAGADGKPIDRVADKTPTAFSADARARWLKGIAHRARTESLAAYEMRLNLDAIKPEPKKLPTIPEGAFLNTGIDHTGYKGRMSYQGPIAASTLIPSGLALPTFAGMEKGAPHIDVSRIGEQIKEALDVKASPQVDMSQAARAKEEAKSAGDAILNSLNVKATPEVDASSISAALGMVRSLKTELAGIGAATARAGSAVQRGVSAGSHSLHDGPEAH